MDVDVAIGLEAWAAANGITVSTVGSVQERILRALRGIADVAGYGGLMHWNNEVLKLLQTISESAGGAVESVNGETGAVVLTAADVGAIEAPSSPSIGQLAVYDGSAWNKLTAGTTGQVLTAVTGDVPAWGSVPLLTLRIGIAATASGLRASLDSSLDGGATWTTGTQVAADATADVDACGATVDASGVTVPAGAGTTGTALANLQRWTWYLDGTGGLLVNLAPGGVNTLLHLAAQTLIGSGSGGHGAIGLAVHPKGVTSRGWWTGVRCDFGAGTKAFERFTGGVWAAGSGLFGRDGLGMTTELRAGSTGVRSTELLRTTAGTAWSEFATDTGTFTADTVLAFSVTARRWATGASPTVIPISATSVAWLVLN